MVEVVEKVEESVTASKDQSEEPKTPEKRSGEEEEGCDRGEVPPSPDPYYPPIIYLPEVTLTLTLTLTNTLTSTLTLR